MVETGLLFVYNKKNAVQLEVARKMSKKITAQFQVGGLFGGICYTLAIEKRRKHRHVIW